MKAHRGFTLIELLVVISIIGLLSSIILASLNSARAKARDARRVSDLKQVAIALALFYDDHGSYPVADCGSGSTPSSHWANQQAAYLDCWNSLQTDLSPYLRKLPVDPVYVDFLNYYYNSTGWSSSIGVYHGWAGGPGQGYLLMALAERPTSIPGDGCWGPPGSGWYTVCVK